jgi:carbon monoxide dehydrogenase subunit G
VVVVQTAEVKVSETFELPVDEQKVWELISDPVRVVPCMPGASLGGVRDDGSIDGSIQASLGPVTVRFSGTVSPEYDHGSYSGRLVARGSDSGGRTKASATTEFHLEAVDKQRTAVKVDATFRVSGGLAPFAQTGGVHLVRSMMADFSANVAAMVGPDTEPGAGHADVETADPPVAARKVPGLRLAVRVLCNVFTDAFDRAARRFRRRPRDEPSKEPIGEHDEGQ